MRVTSIITKRETEVLKLISHEYTTKEVAQMLFISVNTAETHRKNMLSKMGAKNTAGLVRKGFELGLLRVSSELTVYAPMMVS